jgi:hypothetical protein
MRRKNRPNFYIDTEGIGKILTNIFEKITVDNTVNTNVLWFRDYTFSMIFNNRATCQMIQPMINFGAKKD